MFIHKILFYFFLVIPFLILIGCATSYAPGNYLPDTDDVPQNVNGGWITIITEPDSLNSDDNWMQYSGEFISTGDSVIYLLYDSLYEISKCKIVESILELDEKNTTTYGLWVLGGSLLTISNGAYGIYTLPPWLLLGIPTIIDESARDRYEEINPTQEYWESIRKFSRFPQGVSGIDISKIKPFILSEKK